MPSNYDVTLNINFVAKGPQRLDRSATDRTVSLAVHKVGFRAAANRQRKLQANLHRDFAPVVERELQSMARDVSRMAIGLSNPNNPPPGSLSLGGRVSSKMLGLADPMPIASMTGQWATRSKVYMRQKIKKWKTRRWFKNTGRLQDQLKSVGTYRAAYGPVSVKFVPRAIRTDGSGAAVSNLGRGRGGQSTNIQIGRLEVSPLRRLRLSDLPMPGRQARYNEALLSPLADSVERKLAGRKGKYRPVIEPFLSYYLTRRIPNAVYLKLEDSLS